MFSQFLFLISNKGLLNTGISRDSEGETDRRVPSWPAFLMSTWTTTREPKTSCAARLPMLCPAPTAALRIPRAVPTRHRPLRPPHPALGSRTPGHCTQNSTPTTAEDAAQHRTHCSAPAREPHEHARAATRRRITQQPPDPSRTAADPNSTRAKPPQRRPAPRAPTVQVCPKSRATFPKLSTCPTAANSY